MSDTQEEIQAVAKLMKINIDDHTAYVEKVHAMIDYFDILDSADTESEVIHMHEIPLHMLRKDVYDPFEGGKDGNDDDGDDNANDDGDDGDANDDDGDDGSRHTLMNYINTYKGTYVRAPSMPQRG